MKCSSGGAIEEDRVDREDGWESNHPASHSPVGSPREVPDDFTQFYGNFHLGLRDYVHESEDLAWKRQATRDL